MTITEFLLARVAEDERAARTMLEELQESPPSVYDAVQVPWIEAGEPERVLAECKAKRHIVEEHQMWQPNGYRFTDGRQIDVCTTDEQHWPCRTMKALASVYVDHPGYEPAWTITV